MNMPTPEEIAAAAEAKAAADAADAAEAARIAAAGERHPLEEGGKRFNEVYARMKQAEQDRSTLTQQIQTLTEQVSTLASRSKDGGDNKDKEVTVDQVLEAYSGGRITETDKDRYIYLISKRDAKKEGLEELNRTATIGNQANMASGEVNRYIEAIPNLRQVGSDEFKAVASEYQSLLAAGHPDDIRTQHLAIKIAFGPLDRVIGRRRAEDAGRRGDSTFHERGGGGGGDDNGGGDDGNPLKGIPKQQIDFWKNMGYTQEQMVKEAKYFTPKKAWR